MQSLGKNFSEVQSRSLLTRENTRTPNTYIRLIPNPSSTSALASSSTSDLRNKTPCVSPPPHQRHQIRTRSALHPCMRQVADHLIHPPLVPVIEPSSEVLPVLGFDVFVDLGFAEDTVDRHSDVVVNLCEDLLAAVGGHRCLWLGWILQ